MSKTEDLKRAIFAIADPDKASPFNGDMVTLFLHEIEKLVESAIAAELRRRQESELMADCMDMVRRDLIAARVIDATVPPMMVPEAVVAALQTAIAAEREACANICETASFPHQGETQSDAQWSALTLAVAIRARGQK